MSKLIKVPVGQKMCPNCFKFYDDEQPFCRYCGYEYTVSSISLLHLAPGTILKDRYIIGRTLGYGGYGVTYLAYDQEIERIIAIKEYLPSEFSTRGRDSEDLVIDTAEKKLKQFEAGKNKFIEEARKLAQVGDINNVVHMYDCFEENKTAYITMEYLKGVTLEKYIEEHGKLSETETLDLMLPVLSTLSLIHEKGIIHRDISPDNIFITQDKDGKNIAKLIDFGSAKFAIVAQSSKSLTTIFKQGYSPEEQYSSKKKKGTYTDIYSLAAVMYKMLTGINVPDALKRRQMIETGKKDPIIPISKFNRDISRNVEIAIMNAVNVKADDRTQTADEFAGELVSFEKVKRKGPSIHRIDFMRWPIWAKIGVPVMTVAAVAFIVFSVNKMFNNATETVTLPDGMTRVPEFISSTLDTATTKGEEVGIVVQSTSDEYIPGGKSDIVLTQSEDYGIVVSKNSIVSVTVSTGKQIYTLPDVTGMDIEYARYAIECMGLEVVEENGIAIGMANNTVIAQSIDPYTEILSGETITLTVNRTDATSTKDDTFDPTGMNYNDVITEAAKRGVLCVITDKQYTNKYDDYEVISGEYSEDGTLQLVVAIPEREFSMPNLNYKNQDIAVQILKNIGIEAEIERDYNDSVGENLVYSQSKEKDAKVNSGDTITINVSLGGKPVTMVDLQDMTEEEAIKEINKMKLAYTIEYAYSEEVEDGHVMAQSIAAGEDARVGDEITITVCTTKELFTVPDVVGQTSDQAQSAITGVNLKVQIVETYSDTVAKGNVISQLPKAGSLQIKDTTIVLTVSKGAKSSSSSDTGSGPWSDWVTSLPAGVTSSNYQIETKTQYRSITRETTTSTSSSLAGWTLYDQREGWGDYDTYGEWTETKPTSNESTKVNSKVQYSYSDIQTTTSTKSSLSGWTKTGTTQQYSDWSSEMCNYANPVTESDTCHVTRTVTMYSWYYYICSSCGSAQPDYTKCLACGRTTTDDKNNQYRSTLSTSSWSSAQLGTVGGVVYTTIGGQRYFKNGNTKEDWYYYQTRTSSTVNTFEKYSDWSAWQDTPVSSSSTRKVKTRTVYQKVTRSKQYLYYYEKLGTPSAYGFDPITQTSNTVVQTRTVYRYRKK